MDHVKAQVVLKIVDRMAKKKTIRVPVRSKEPIQALLKTIWNYIKTQPSGDIVPLVFPYLEQKLSEFLDSRNLQELSSTGNSHEGETEQGQLSKLILLPIRKPVQRKPITPDQQSRIYPSAIAASFGVTSPSEQDNPSERVDLHQMLVQDPAKTFFLSVAGDSMNQAGINDGDLVVVQQLTDAWSQLKSGSIVTALVDGNPTVKQFEKKREKIFLSPRSNNPEHETLEIIEGMDIRLNRKLSVLF